MEEIHDLQRLVVSDKWRLSAVSGQWLVFLFLVDLSTRQLLCHKYTKSDGLCQVFRAVFWGGERRKLSAIGGEKVVRVKFHN